MSLILNKAFIISINYFNMMLKLRERRYDPPIKASICRVQRETYNRVSMHLVAFDSDHLALQNKGCYSWLLLDTVHPPSIII
jgi:hypothetical protein